MFREGHYHYNLVNKFSIRVVSLFETGINEEKRTEYKVNQLNKPSQVIIYYQSKRSPPSLQALCYQKGENTAMDSISDILQLTSHRTFPKPNHSWKYCQEWHNVFFAHWKVPSEYLKPLIPKGLEIDTYDGESWISLVAFSVRKLRPRYIPSLSLLSDFHEVNIRTYVKRNDKPGIWFLSLEAQKSGSAAMGRLMAGLNYLKSSIVHEQNFHESFNRNHNYYIKARYKPDNGICLKSDLDRWLTDRFSLYHEMSGTIYSNDIHHRDWPLKTVAMEEMEMAYRYGDFLIGNDPDLAHYSDGIKVLTWGKKRS